MRAALRTCAALLLASLGARAAADAAAQAGATTYVSERFKKLAVKVAREVLANEIAGSCPPEQPLCPVVAKRLGDAVGAAIESDDHAVRAALNGLFVDASMGGLVQLTGGGLWSGPQPHLDPAVVRPLVDCLAASLTSKPWRAACSASDDAARLLEALFEKYPCVGRDAPVCAALVTAVKGRTAIQPSVALGSLAALAVSDAVRRPDIRVLLLGLSGLIESGVEAGLSPALLRYLSTHLSSDESVEFFMTTLMVDYRPDVPAQNALWDDGALDRWGKAVTACGQPMAALDAWRTGRGALLSTWRRQILLGQDVNFGPLTALLDYRCPADKAGSAEAKAIRQLQDAVRFFTAQSRVYVWLLRYGAGGLAAAASVDYVRTGDDTRLERDLARTLAYGLASAGRQRLVAQALQAEQGTAGKPGTPLTGDGFLWMGDALASCEVTALTSVLGVTMPEAKQHVPVPKGECLSLVSGGFQQPLRVPQRPAGMPMADWIRAHAPVLVALLAPAAAYVAPGVGGELGEIDPSVLERARTALADGDSATARLVLLRAGVDLLAAHLEHVSAEMVGASEERCREDLRARTIFSPIGRGCVVHALLTGAYRPIAEYYWAGGRSPEELATAGYRGLLADPALQYTPIILNVGLGGTMVFGKEGVWGSSPYAALTVLDKIGLAFYKRLDPRNPFEVGVFAGGFLDALIRTAADSGKDQRYWLLGLTAGFTKLGGIDLGLEVHAGAAMPFALNKKSNYGFATGVAVVVPFDTYFAE